MYRYLIIISQLLLLTACLDSKEERVDLRNTKVNNPTAYIPPQCYSNLRRPQNKVGNSCFTCHTGSTAPNYIDDGDVQLSYGFPEPALKNPWENLFKNRSAQIAEIDDTAILNYVREDNYHNEDGVITLAEILKDLPEEWDVNGNGQWDGYMPDTYFNFDEDGFDRNPNGKYSGWRVFAYHPLAGAFMPTNGSTGDVLIRLPDIYRQDASGNYNSQIYKMNLAVLEAYIKRQDIVIDKVGEKSLEADLDKDGQLSFSHRIAYRWSAVDKSNNTQFVGMAGKLQKSGAVKVAPGLYPVGTEFLHSVRYIDSNGTGTTMALRMKELRYARKDYWTSYGQFQDKAMEELKERHDFPDRLKAVIGNAEEGVNNRLGWTYQGFIENKSGQLRPQTYEEHVFCMGCHAGVGVNQDNIFTFQRKLGHDQFKQGWYHWLEKGLEGIPERLREDGEHEYSYYLKHNKAGDDFAANAEVLNKFFADGEAKPLELAKLHGNIAHLLMPSPERAMTLNKAYKIIVEEQSYYLGRDPVVSPLEAHQSVELDQETGVKEELSAF